MKKYLLSGLAFYALSINAQMPSIAPKAKSESHKINKTDPINHIKPKSGTAIWGACATVGVSEGEFATAFVQSGTSSNYSVTQWTALSINDNGGANLPGAAYWVRNTTGYPTGAYYPGTTPVSSSSQTNGVACFNSDFLDNNGTPGNFGLGTSPSAHKGELISPRIDLTGQTDVPLEISFFSIYRDHQISELSVSMSTDDGVSWSSPVDYRNIHPDFTEGYIKTLFTNVTAGVSNLTQCRIKFTFDGDYYFAMVDDVCISEASPYDLAIGISDPASSTLNTLGSQFHLSNNRYFPGAQVGSHNFQRFGANVSNLGFEDVLITDNAKISVEVQKDQSGAWSTVFQDTINIDAIIGNAIVTVTDTISDYSWVTQGDFRTIYRVFGLTDNNSNNDSIAHNFSITTDYASKVDLDVNNKPLASSSVASAGGPYSKIEWGSIFNFPNAGSFGMEIDSISFKYFVTNSFTGADSQSYFASIYEFNDLGTYDGVLNDVADLDLLGTGVINISGLTSSLGMYGNATVKNLTDTITGNPMAPLSDGKQYYISITIEPSQTGGAATFNPVDDVIQIGTSSLKNYYLNSLNSPVCQPSPIHLIDASGITSWYWSGYGLNTIPSMGVHFTAVCSPSSSSTNVTACDSVEINGTVYNSSQTVTEVITHPLTGCDSTASTVITINSVDNTISNISTTLTAAEIGATYQWLDCQNNFMEISGEVAQDYTPLTNGQYAVAITKNGCTDTSACMLVNSVGVSQYNTNIGLGVYPNPASDKINITLNDVTNSSYNLTIYNSIGELVLNTTITNATTVINTNDYAAGVYVVKVSNANDIAIERITIE